MREATAASWLGHPAALDGAGRVRAFAGEPDSASALLTPLLGSAALSVTGADRLEFVHGQVSCEVKRLPEGGFSEGLLLNHKGQALAQLSVLRQGEAVLVAVDGGAGERVAQQLREHIIFDDVTLEPLAWTTLTLQGDSAASILQSVVEETLPEAGRWLETTFGGAPLLVRPARRTGAGGYDLLVSTEAAGAVFTALIATGATPAGEDALDLGRVLAGIPSAEREAGEGVLPQEAGLGPLVNYRKGCYLGQEIMARIEARGTLRRSLHGLKLEAWPEEGVRDVLSRGKVVGRLGTVAEHPELGVVALAVLRNDLGEGDGELSVSGIRAKLEPLPF